MRKYGRQDVCLTVSPGTGLDGDTCRSSLLSGFLSLDMSGCAQLCFENNSTELWVGHFFSNLRRGEKDKELCPFFPLRNSYESSGLPGGRSSPSFDSGSALITAQHLTLVTEV